MLKNIKNIQNYSRYIQILLGVFLCVFLGSLSWFLYKTFAQSDPLSLLRVQDTVAVIRMDYSEEGRRQLLGMKEKYLSWTEVLARFPVQGDILHPDKALFDGPTYVVVGKEYHIIAGPVLREKVTPFLLEPYPGYEAKYEKGTLFLLSGRTWESVVSDKNIPSLEDQLSKKRVTGFGEDVLSVLSLHMNDSMALLWSVFSDFHIEQYLSRALLPDLSWCLGRLPVVDGVPRVVLSCGAEEDSAFESLASLPALPAKAILPLENNKHTQLVGFAYDYDRLMSYGRALEEKKDVPVSLLISSLLGGGLQKLYTLSTLPQYIKDIPPGAILVDRDVENGNPQKAVIFPAKGSMDKAQELAKKFLELSVASTRVKETVMLLPDRTRGVVLSVEPVEAQQMTQSGSTLLAVEDFDTAVRLYDEYVLVGKKDDLSRWVTQEVLTSYSTKDPIHALFRLTRTQFQSWLGDSTGLLGSDESTRFEVLLFTLHFASDRVTMVLTPERASSSAL